MRFLFIEIKAEASNLIITFSKLYTDRNPWIATFRAWSIENLFLHANHIHSQRRFSDIHGLAAYLVAFCPAIQSSSIKAIREINLKLLREFCILPTSHYQF